MTTDTNIADADEAAADAELAIPDQDGTLAVWSGTPSEDSMAMLRRHVEAMKIAHELAVPLVRTQLVPQRWRGKADDATAAILYGAELGLNPIQSLQRVIVIHGTPTIEARTMVALLKRHGYRVWTEATSDTSVTVLGVGPDGNAEAATWTIERAAQAGYVPQPSSDKSLKRPTVEDDWVTVTKSFDGKSKKSVVGNMKYRTDPQAMLYAKAAAEVCRKLAPDVLLGIAYTTEDIQSEPRDDYDAEPVRRDKVRSERGGRGVDSLRARAQAAADDLKAHRDEPVDAETVDDRPELINEIKGILDEADCTDPRDVSIVLESILGADYNPAAELTDDQLKTVLTRLASTPLLADKIRDVLNEHDLKAEQAKQQAPQQDAEQPTLDDTN